ncbi:hypothetical protein BXZ70DRAFT_906221 [Cristinia sonorae]|uniref:Uncharacterized protein n=1 Tax=Cristinia sonorae TaxID=1940300 RepID=A0A8K0UR99_9AGAR|nr:hypothetical protein BXZ70DRAFT_906221 [Cristinia sonorae]
MESVVHKQHNVPTSVQTSAKWASPATPISPGGLLTEKGPNRGKYARHGGRLPLSAVAWTKLDGLSDLENGPKAWLCRPGAVAIGPWQYVTRHRGNLDGRIKQCDGELESLVVVVLPLVAVATTPTTVLGSASSAALLPCQTRNVTNCGWRFRSNGVVIRAHERWDGWLAQGSIFPEAPSRYSYAKPPIPDGRPEIVRRRTGHLEAASAPRRDPRPLRSSPLAGPSLALDALSSSGGSDESGNSESSEGKPRYRPSRISSTPDVPSMLTIFEAADTSHTLVSSRSETSVSTLLPSPPPKAALASSSVQDEDSKKSSRRSWGPIKLISLPAITPPRPSSMSFKLTSQTPSSRSGSQSKTQSTSTVAKAEHVAPPVPQIPVWALPSHTTSSPSTRPKRHPNLSPNGKTHMRRPSTAPSPSIPNMSPELEKLNRRRSVFHGPPSTSRDPELNWMSQAAPPQFSRRALKAENVIMPVSAKEALRRSTASTISTISAVPAAYGKGKEREGPTWQPSSPSAPSIQGSTRTPSRSSMVSFSTAQQDFLPTPPSPPFRSSMRSGSYSSIESTLSLTPPSTPGLSSSRSPSVISEDEPEDPSYFGSRRSKESQMGVLEVRVNDVHVETIVSPGFVDASRGGKNPMKAVSGLLPRGISGSTVTITAEKTVAGDGSRGKGSLGRAWRRVVASIRG